MYRLAIKSAILCLSMLLATAVCAAAVVTVGLTGQYPTRYSAVRVAAAGDTVQIDYNNGIPCKGPYDPNCDPNGGHRSDCVWHVDNLTIVGVNGQPILDASGEVIERGIFNPYGAGGVISNLERRGAATQPEQRGNGGGVRVDSGSTAPPAGDDITIQYCYIHHNEDGVLTANVGPGTGESYLSANPYITCLHDEFAYNGVNGDGHTYNMSTGFDGNETTTFTLAYSWSHDANIGHTVKTRAPVNNVHYNLITDEVGATSHMLNFPLGGNTYVVGNAIYKGARTNSNANKNGMLWRHVYDNTPTDPAYGLPNEHLHFINNTVVLSADGCSPAYVIASCFNGDVSSCAAPNNGLVLSVNAVVERFQFASFQGSGI